MTKYEVTLEGFTVHNETWDHVLEVDGKRDEVYIYVDTRLLDQAGKLLLTAEKQTPVMGDINGYNNRVKAGTASSQGGLLSGDQFPYNNPWQRQGNLKSNQPPMLLWSGELTDNTTVTITPTIWEWDGGSDLFTEWSQALVENGPKITDAVLKFINAINSGGTPLPSDAIKTSLETGLPALRKLMTTILGQAGDRPIGMVQEGDNFVFKPRSLVLNKKLTESVINHDFGYGPGVIGIRYQDAPKLAGNYMLYLKVAKNVVNNEAPADTNPIQIPGWFGAENQGGDIALADLNKNGQPDLVTFHIDNPGGENRGYYRVGRNIDGSGKVTGGWTNHIQIPGWFGAENQGGGIALADINRNGKPDLIVFHIDNPGGENRGYYRIGRDIDANGKVLGGWTNHIQIPGWFGAENQGGGIALADINRNGQPDLIVFHIDNPGGENRGYYRIGRNIDANGKVTGGWTNPIQIPGWFGAENQGGGIALADLNGNGQPDLIVFHIDNPGGENRGYYRIGRNIDANGNVTGGWTNHIQIPGWFGGENQGGGIALADLNKNGQPDLIVFHIDNPGGENRGYYRIKFNMKL